VDFRNLETVLVITTFEPVDVEGAIGEETTSGVEVEATLSPTPDATATPKP
jgi:hypothetical protein